MISSAKAVLILAFVAMSGVQAAPAASQGSGMRSAHGMAHGRLPLSILSQLPSSCRPSGVRKTKAVKMTAPPTGLPSDCTASFSQLMASLTSSIPVPHNTPVVQRRQDEPAAATTEAAATSSPAAATTTPFDEEQPLPTGSGEAPSGVPLFKGKGKGKHGKGKGKGKHGKGKGKGKGNGKGMPNGADSAPTGAPPGAMGGGKGSGKAGPDGAAKGKGNGKGKGKGKGGSHMHGGGNAAGGDGAQATPPPMAI